MIRRIATVLLLFFFTTLRSQIDQSKINIAISKGTNYLNSLPDSLFPSYNQKLLLKYLYLKYDSTNIGSRRELKSINLLAEDIPIYNYYQRIITPSEMPVQDSLLAYFNKSDGIQKLMIWGIYPDVLFLDDECISAFDELVRDKIQTRNLAHAALALHWSEKYRNSITSAGVQNYYQRFAPLLKQGTLQEGIVTDSGMEGIVGLICLNKANEIPFDWVQQITEAQNKNGSWSFNPNVLLKADTHATLLALWILYDFKSRFL